MEQSMPKIQNSLVYGSSYMPSRINRLRAQPVSGSGPYSPENPIIRVELNNNALIRLSSLSAYFNLTVSGLSDTSDSAYVNALIPYSPKLFSSIVFYVNNVPVSGHLSSHQDILATILAKATASEDWCLSRLQNGASELVYTADDSDGTNKDLFIRPGATSKTQFMVLDQILGLPNCNAGQGVLDSSIFGQVSIEFRVNTKYILACVKAGTGDESLDAPTFSISNFHVEYDSIVSVSNEYLQLMKIRVQDPKPINFAYQNYSTNISSSGTSGSVRGLVSSSCVDMVVVAPLPSTYASRTSMDNANINTNRYKFDSGRNYATAANTRLSFTTGSEQYPRSQIDNALKIFDLTQNSLAHNNQWSNSVLTLGRVSGGTTRSRLNFIQSNCVWIQALSSESEGWASPDRVLTGLSTNGANQEFVFDYQNFGTSNGYLFTAFLMSSILQYDTTTAQVRVLM